jgi:EAL domain-containing protein (putative c-di-GMP-specific phosphodiesterase class I)
VAWQARGLPTLRVSVNLAARTLLYDPRLLDKVQAALAESGLRPHQLELEITEKVLQTEEPSIALLTALKDLGVTLAIDDFGTGYSCLNSLKQLPIDALKIDRSFIRDIPHDPNDTAISTAIIVMGHSLNLRVIAEGVATSEQQAFLRDKGCDEMQGYFFSKPVLADVVARMMKQNKRIA